MQIPLGQLADISLVTGPAMIRDENGRLSGYVFVDLDTSKRDIGSYVADAKKVIREKVTLPPGYQLIWSGQFEFMERVKERLIVVSDYHLPGLSAPLLQYSVGHQDDDHSAGRALFRRWRHLVSLSPRLQHEHRRLGWVDRPDGSGCRNGHVHAPLPDLAYHEAQGKEG